MADLRHCLRQPISEIEQAAECLDDAVTAHLAGNRDRAAELFRQADSKAVWNWLDSVWGKSSEYNRARTLSNMPPVLPRAERATPRAPTAATVSLIHERDGFYCRFCGVPVVRGKVRQAMVIAYPEAVSWAKTNTTQHAALQCMWAQYDHIVPHARGGTSTIDNMVLTCAACNFGKVDFTLEQMGLHDPRLRAPRVGPWEGLERFLQTPRKDVWQKEPKVEANPVRSSATLRGVVNRLASKTFVGEVFEIMARHESEHGPVTLRIGVSPQSKFKWPSYRIDDAATGELVVVMDGLHRPWVGGTVAVNGHWSSGGMSLAEVAKLLDEVTVQQSGLLPVHE